MVRVCNENSKWKRILSDYRRDPLRRSSIRSILWLNCYTTVKTRARAERWSNRLKRDEEKNSSLWIYALQFKPKHILFVEFGKGRFVSWVLCDQREVLTIYLDPVKLTQTQQFTVCRVQIFVFFFFVRTALVFVRPLFGSYRFTHAYHSTGRA